MAETLELPGFIDIHTHLREPSPLNRSEAIANGTRAALLGGFVMVCDMPNNPGLPTWTEERLRVKQRLAIEKGYMPVGFYAGCQPEFDNVSELEGMSRTALGLKLYGAATTGNDIDYEAAAFGDIVEEWHRVAPQKPILFHAGKENLQDMIDLVAGEMEHPLHVCHVNDPAEVRAVNRAKAKAMPVTCGVCPHHLFKTSHDPLSQGWLARMQPPLAHQTDVEKLWRMLRDGEIDIIETDYAPHSLDAKLKAEHDNPHGTHESGHTTCYGVPGIEHAVAILLRQALLGRLTLDRLIDACSTQPQRLLGIELPPNTSVTWRLDEYIIKESDVVSGAGWTPYPNAIAAGSVERVVINGHTVLDDGEPVKPNKLMNSRIRKGWL
jgi:dihydroorotase